MIQKIRQLVSGMFVFLAGDLFAKALGFLLVPLYTHALGTDDFGILNLLVVSSSFMITALKFGLNIALLRYYSSTREELQKKIVFSTYVFVLLINLVILTSIGLVFSLNSQLTQPFGFVSANLIIWALVSIFMELTLFIPETLLRAENKNKLYVGISLVKLLVRLPLIILLVVYFKLGIVGVLAGGIAGNAVVSICMGIWLVRKYHSKISFEAIKPLFSYGFPLLPSPIFALILSVSDRYFLQHYRNLSEVGIYALAYQIGSILQIVLISPFQMARAPLVYQWAENKSQFQKLYAKITTYFVLVGLLGVLGIWFFVNPLIPSLFGAEFARASNVLPLLLLSFFVFGLSETINVGLFVENKTQIYLSANASGALVNLLLNFLLIPPAGMDGAALATILSYAWTLIVSLFYANKYVAITYEYGRLSKIAISFALTVLMYLLGIHFGISRWILTLALFVFPLLLLLFGVLQKDEKLAFFKLVSGFRSKRAYSMR